MTAPVAYVGSYTHEPRGLRRSRFAVRVIASAPGDPATYWFVRECPACGREHDRVPVAWRKPRRGEKLARAVDLGTVAEPLPDENAQWPHPIERRLSLD